MLIGFLEDHIKNGFMILRGKLRRLPGVHQATVRVLVEHLARVAAKSQKNKYVPPVTYQCWS